MKPLDHSRAALAAAFLAIFFLGPFAFGQADVPPAVVVATDDRHPVNVLAKLLRDNAEARAAAGKRASEFLLNTDAGKRFVSAEAGERALDAVAREWANKEEAGRLAELYLVMGPGGDALPWADPVFSKTFKPGMPWEGRLRAALEKYTASDQIAQTREKEGATAFLEYAADRAAEILNDLRTKSEIDAGITGNDTTAPRVPTPNGGASTLKTSAQRYTFENLYRDGAIVAKVYGPGDKTARLISAKMYTSRDADGTLVNKIGIFDITDPNAVFGQRFDFGVGEQTFALNDSAPGHRKYTLKIGTDEMTGERNIVFMRPDSWAARGPFGVAGAIGNAIRRRAPHSSALSTSVEKLLLKRAAAAAAQEPRNIVSVGGRDFYVTPQGGGKGALVFLPKDKVDRRSLETARDLRPDLYAEVVQTDTEGRGTNLPGKRHLGAIGGKEYHLAFKTGLWYIMDGPGDDKPKPPSPPPPPPPSPPKPGPAVASNASSDWKSAEADMAEMDADLRVKHGIFWRQDPQLGLEYSVQVPQTMASDGRLLYKSVTTDKDGAVLTPPLVLQRVLGWKHYLIVQFDRRQQYLDLLQPDAKNGFKLVVNAETMADGLKRFGASPVADKQHLHAGPS